MFGPLETGYFFVGGSTRVQLLEFFVQCVDLLILVLKIKLQSLERRQKGKTISYETSVSNSKILTSHRLVRI